MYPTRARVARSRVGRPSRVIAPAVGRARDRRSLTRVVLPARLGPSRPNTVPAGTVRLTPATAVTPDRARGPVLYTLSTCWNSAAAAVTVASGGTVAGTLRVP